MCTTTTPTPTSCPFVEGAEHDRAVTDELLEHCLLTCDRMLTLPGRVPRWRAPVTLLQLEAGPVLDVERLDLLGAIDVADQAELVE